MVKKIKASFICLVLTHMCFAGAKTRNSRQAATDAAVAGSAAQMVTSPESCVSKIDQLSERVYREARESGREVDVKDLGRQRAEIANKCVAAFSIKVTRQRISARLRLVDHYLSGKEDPNALRHEMAIVNLSEMLPADAQQAALNETISTLDSLALFVCSEAGAARSRAIIEQIPPELVHLAHAEERLGGILSRYLMDGREAPQLFPRNVLNAPNGEDFGRVHEGQVTVMLFAAYWCGPCHAIYPQVIDIYRRFQDNGVRALLVTQLSNPANDPKQPTPEEEVATIQKFYVDEVKMPFPIVIEGPVDVKPSGDKSIDQQKLNRQTSLFGFYPMMLVIDKKGRTRAILIGTLPGQAERLRAKVEELLREPA